MKNVPEGDPDQIESEVSCKGLVIGKNGAAHPSQADETETPSTVKDEDDIASHGHANRKKKAYRSSGKWKPTSTANLAGSWTRKVIKLSYGSLSIKDLGWRRISPHFSIHNVVMIQLKIQMVLYLLPSR